MFTRPFFEPDRAASLAFADARGFGTVCACNGGKPVASSLPFYLSYGDDGTPHALFTSPVKMRWRASRTGNHPG
jgi:transcriptional regulator